MASISVLVTDDDDYVRRAVARLLRHHGLHVVCASSGPEALEIVAAAPPSLVLLDVMMPGMDGVRVAHILREQHGDACPPIAIMSAGPMSETRRLAAGALGFLRKPFTAEMLLSLVERCTQAADAPESTATAPMVHPS